MIVERSKLILPCPIGLALKQELYKKQKKNPSTNLPVTKFSSTLFKPLCYAFKENFNQNYHYTDKSLQHILMLISSIKKWYVLVNKMNNECISFFISKDAILFL